MSTNAEIYKLNEDGSVDGIACHNYGYLSFVGYILQNYYRDPQKVAQLFKLGELSMLGAHLETAPAIAKYGKDFRYNPKFKALPETVRDHMADQYYGTTIDGHPEDTYTQAYKRDLGGSSDNVCHFKSYRRLFDRDLKGVGSEYQYLYRNGKWYAVFTSEFGYLPKMTLAKALNQPEYQ